jgi:hypothetical protein
MKYLSSIALSCSLLLALRASVSVGVEARVADSDPQQVAVARSRGDMPLVGEMIVVESLPGSEQILPELERGGSAAFRNAFRQDCFPVGVTRHSRAIRPDRHIFHRKAPVLWVPLLPIQSGATSTSEAPSPVGRGTVFRSSASLQWQLISPSDVYQTLDIDVDPDDPMRLYLTTGDPGTYRSMDGGSSWELVLGRGFFRELVIDPQDRSVIYTAPHLYDPYVSGVFRSTDAGESWTHYNDGMTDTNVGTLAIAASSPNILFAGSF